MPYDTSSTVHCRSSSQTTPATSLCGFSMTLTTTPHSTQQLMAVWDPLLQDDPEVPTFISNTALLSSDSGFYIRTSQSHSRHTVFPTEHHEIIDIGSAAVQPMNNVMHLAPYRASIAPGMGATTVAGGNGFALRRGDTPLLAAHIQRLALPVQDDRGDLRIAQHPAQFAGGGHTAELQLRTPSLAPHGLDVHDRGDVWPFAALGG